jgi:LysR family glycine cleavage system transcriptional activator
MPFRPPSLSLVVAFEAAARYQNFARAADELNLTHSAISHAVRNLEGRIGQPLFNRHGRRVALTPHGAELAQRVRAGLKLMSDAFGDEQPAGASARVILGAPPEFSSQVLFSLPGARELLARCEIRGDLTVDALREGRADLVIAPGGEAWPGLASRRLRRDHIFPVVAPYLISAQKTPELGEVAMIENLSYPWRLWLCHQPGAEAPQQYGLVVNDWRLAIDAAKAGLGACLTRSSLVREELESGDLVRLGQAQVSADSDYHLIWNPQAALSGSTASIIERLTGQGWLVSERMSDAYGAPAAACAV